MKQKRREHDKESHQLFVNSNSAPSLNEMAASRLETNNKRVNFI